MKSEVKISDNRLEMTRTFDAPRERVFDAWKQVDKVQQWWGCANTTKVESVIDFREGGTFSHTMHIEGAGVCPMAGRFDKIVEPELISYHTDFGEIVGRVSVEFHDVGGNQTRLVLTQVGFPPIPDHDPRDIIAAGFTAALEKLGSVVAQAA